MDPPHLFATETDPCLYENLATGLMCKCYEANETASLFASWEGDHRAQRLDEVAWLVLERGAYLREREERPALDSLRREFLAHLSPRERDVSALIEKLPAKQLADLAGARVEIAQLQKTICGFDGQIVRAPMSTLHLGVSLLSHMDRGGKHGKSGRLVIHSALDPQAHRGARATIKHAAGKARELRTARKEAEDRAYVEALFGPLSCAQAELEQLERRICTAPHQGCRLWIADATRSPGPTANRELHQLRAQAEEQFQKNCAFYESRLSSYDSITDSLARHLRDVLASASHEHERRHRSGQLETARAWRAGVLGDRAVFSRRVQTTNADISLDLLLDASGSRSGKQAEIAAQAYIVGRAFRLCGVPVRIGAFATVRNHTALRFFCDYGKASQLKNVFRYYATGFNRDGLALACAGELIEHGLAPLKASPARNRLLVVLTDAAPMDERPIEAPDSPLDGRPYVGRPAVRDTAGQVRALQVAGLRVAALYTGSGDFVHDAKAIYDSSFAHIHRIEQMAPATAALIDTLLQ